MESNNEQGGAGCVWTPEYCTKRKSTMAGDCVTGKKREKDGPGGKRGKRRKGRHKKLETVKEDIEQLEMRHWERNTKDRKEKGIGCETKLKCCLYNTASVDNTTRISINLKHKYFPHTKLDYKLVIEANKKKQYSTNMTSLFD